MSSESVPTQNGEPLTQELLAELPSYLSQHYPEDLLACAKATEGFDWTEQAKVTQLDITSITLEVSGRTNVQSLRLHFPTPAKDMASLQRIVSNMLMPT